MGHNNGHSDRNQSYGQYNYNKVQNNCCVNGNALSRWNLEGALGGGFLVGGDGLTGSRTNIPTTNLRNVGSEDLWDDGLRAELGGSYALNPNRKITGNVFYQENESAGVLNLGDLDGDAFRGSVSDRESYGVELGLRQYFTPKVYGRNIRLRPYIEGKLGAANLDDISLQNVTRDGTALADVGLYEGGWVPTAAGMVGIETPIAKRMTLGVETGLRYQGRLKSDGRSIVSGTGNELAGINNGSDTWTVPLQVRGRYRF